MVENVKPEIDNGNGKSEVSETLTITSPKNQSEATVEEIIEEVEVTDSEDEGEEIVQEVTEIEEVVTSPECKRVEKSGSTNETNDKDDEAMICSKSATSEGPNSELNILLLIDNKLNSFAILLDSNN